ncbi:hypothetical protein [Thalassolituus oleivorans]|jgi:glucosamine--fructose-6-phosphate aminotransferase (isomerizing)|uniref:Uncharacterized protein n=2 Tax=root TaxID=1 RepID=M5DN52_9GAMM|nr:hypothetical protein [Thalassolituus oleivorans]AHK17155.1 hypothetical protein R615_00300 [Thalassolituus oleivorans R6-15]CCU70512.1 hypothetical protein TOL_0063 [Thalassolituus oleivorans MIL-1]|tara:strand:- start:37 stop:159 length:123 start_codon:yes stop_codon:yes gene_type:complete
MIDAEMPIVVVAPHNDLIEKLKSNIEEMRADCLHPAAAVA